MKEGWKYCKLGEVATFARGLTYSKKDEAEISDNVVLRSNNVDLSTGKLCLDELKYLKSDFLIPQDKCVKKGSLLICMSNGSKSHLGKVAYIEKDYNYAFGGFMGLVTPADYVDGKYLHYALSSPFYKNFIKELSAGANINNIKVRDLQEFTIPVPPLSTQQSIVTYLDTSFSLIDSLAENAKKALENAKALFQAELKKLMEKKEGWEEKKIEEVSENLDYRRKPITKSKRESGVYPYYGASGIVDYVKDYIYDEDILLVSEDGANLLARSTPIAFSVSGKVWVNNHAHVLKFENIYTQRFVEYFFASIDISPYVTGAAQPKFNQARLNSLIVPVPPLSEQQKIVQTLDTLSQYISQLEQNYNKTLDNCQALKQALLRKTFE